MQDRPETSVTYGAVMESYILATTRPVSQAGIDEPRGFCVGIPLVSRVFIDGSVQDVSLRMASCRPSAVGLPMGFRSLSPNLFDRYGGNIRPAFSSRLPNRLRKTFAKKLADSPCFRGRCSGVSEPACFLYLWWPHLLGGVQRVLDRNTALEPQFRLLDATVVNDKIVDMRPWLRNVHDLDGAPLRFFVSPVVSRRCRHP
jgi:hypothetical protein